MSDILKSKINSKDVKNSQKPPNSPIAVLFDDSPTKLAIVDPANGTPETPGWGREPSISTVEANTTVANQRALSRKSFSESLIRRKHNAVQ